MRGMCAVGQPQEVEQLHRRETQLKAGTLHAVRALGPAQVLQQMRVSGGVQHVHVSMHV